MTPKDFAKLTMNSNWYCSRSCSADSLEYMPKKAYLNIDECFSEMKEWADSGIWYAHLFGTLNDDLKKELSDLGYSVYDYFGQTGIGWLNAEYGGMVKFDPEKDLLTLKKGDWLSVSYYGESFTVIMNNKHSGCRKKFGDYIEVVNKYLDGTLKIYEIQRLEYWD